MKCNKLLLILIVTILCSVGVLAGDFKIQYPVGTDIFTVSTNGNVSITGFLDIPDDKLQEADINFITTCGTGNHLYISGTNLACEADDAGISGLTLAADTGTPEALADTDTITIAGGTGGIDTNVAATDTVTITLDWTEVASNAIAEAKVSFDTSCATGNHLYIDGSNNLACEADDDLPDADEITETMLKEVSTTPTDEDILTYEATTGDFEWHIPSDLITAGTHLAWTTNTLDVADDWWDDDADLSANEIGEGKISFATTCGTGNHLYISGTDLACEADQVGGMDYTNVAMVNETNTFAENQVFNKNITLGIDARINGSGSADSYFKIDASGNVVVVLA